MRHFDAQDAYVAGIFKSASDLAKLGLQAKRSDLDAAVFELIDAIQLIVGSIDRRIVEKFGDDAKTLVDIGYVEMPNRDRLPSYKFRAECQADVFSLAKIVQKWCLQHNEAVDEATGNDQKMSRLPSGMLVNKLLEESSFDPATFQKKLADQNDNSPPKLYFLIHTLRSYDNGWNTVVCADTNIPQDRLKELMKRVPSGHVMLETLATVYDYTGNRTYEE